MLVFFIENEKKGREKKGFLSSLYIVSSTN